MKGGIGYEFHKTREDDADTTTRLRISDNTRLNITEEGGLTSSNILNSIINLPHNITSMREIDISPHTTLEDMFNGNDCVFFWRYRRSRNEPNGHYSCMVRNNEDDQTCYWFDPLGSPPENKNITNIIFEHYNEFVYNDIAFQINQNTSINFCYFVSGLNNIGLKPLDIENILTLYGVNVDEYVDSIVSRALIARRGQQILNGQLIPNNGPRRTIIDPDSDDE